MSEKLNMKRRLETVNMPVYAAAAQRPKLLFEKQESWQKQKSECLALIGLICELCYEYAEQLGIVDNHVKPKTMTWSEYHYVLYAIYEAFYECAEQGYSHMRMLPEGALSPFHGGEPRYQFDKMNTIGENGVFRLYHYNGLGWTDIGEADYYCVVNMPTEFR